MAVFRMEKTRDYTVMSNHHLRDKSLSLKAKGLLSLMLSLPEEWDYTTKGLARICKDGVDSICAGVRELEEHGYVIRQRVRNANGQLGAIEYTILEQPRPPEPKPGKPERENPVLDNPEQAYLVLGKPEQENPAQLNIKGSSKDTGPATLYVYPALSGMAANACRSLREALSRINGKALRYDVTVTFFTSQAETLYEMEGVEISGVTGPHTLRIEGMDRNKTLSTFLTVSSCTARIELSYLNIRDCRGLVGGTSKNSYLINARNNTFLSLTGCVLDLNNVTANAVQATASYVDLRYCEIRSAYIGLGLESATGNLYYCKGQCTFSVFCMSGIAFCTGTVPSGGRTSSCNGQIFDAGVTTDAGATVAPQTPDDTTLQYATLTKSYRGGWRTDTVDVVQGVYSDDGYSAGLSWNYGCMWFGNLRGVLSGKTVKSATLTLYRKTGSGSGAARTLYLCAITNTTASGAPAVAANYGAIGALGRAEQMTFAIPPAVAEGLANGTFGGLCLYESPYNFGASNWSANYMRIAGTDSSDKPCLRVIYGGTAAG